MTAPTPSPEEFACSVWELMEAKNSNGAGDLIRARDAALLAPLREEVERLTCERAAATRLMEYWRAKSRERIAGLDFRRIVASVAVEMDKIGGGGSSASNVRAWSARLSDALAGLPPDDAERAEAENARLREALRPFAEFGAVVGGNARDHVCGMYVAVGKRRDLHVSDFRAAAKALAPEGGK